MGRAETDEGLPAPGVARHSWACKAIFDGSHRPRLNTLRHLRALRLIGS
jgi:hypothetical protein